MDRNFRMGPILSLKGTFLSFGGFSILTPANTTSIRLAGWGAIVLEMDMHCKNQRPGNTSLRPSMGNQSCLFSFFLLGGVQVGGIFVPYRRKLVS